MKIISVPDVHGSHEWEKVKDISKDSYDFIVFHGDYFDSWTNNWPDQGDNFKNICNFVREDPVHRKMLIGNHDFSYITSTRDGQCVSGHQNGKALLIKKLLLDNIDIIDLAFECDNYVFSHAGFSKTWVEMYLLPYMNKEFSISVLNELWHSFSNKRDYAFDKLLDWNGCFSGSGDEETQGPLWIRPASLLRDAYFNKQIVGHTEYCLFNNVYLKENDNLLIMCDSKIHKVFDIIDTEIEYKTLTLKECTDYYYSIKSIIYNIKTEQFATFNYDDVFSKLQEHFGKNAEIAYKIFFKE